MKLCRITVYDYDDKDDDMAEPTEYKVKAYCLQGETGFRAWFINPNNKKQVIEAHGDDGHWWVIGTFSKHWLKEYKETLNTFAKTILK
jgi:hypothetical protein